MRVVNMNSEGLSDSESNLLEGVDRWCWGGEETPPHSARASTAYFVGTKNISRHERIQQGLHRNQ